MDAQQTLFTELLTELWEDFGEDNVHDGKLPPDGTPYPFVYLGDTTDNDLYRTKDAIWGRATIRIHVWSDKPQERGTLSAMMETICQRCRAVENIGTYTYEIRSLTTNILPDNTTKTPLLHGVIDATYAHY